MDKPMQLDELMGAELDTARLQRVVKGTDWNGLTAGEMQQIVLKDAAKQSVACTREKCPGTLEVVDAKVRWTFDRQRYILLFNKVMHTTIRGRGHTIPELHGTRWAQKTVGEMHDIIKSVAEAQPGVKGCVSRESDLSCAAKQMEGTLAVTRDGAVEFSLVTVKEEVPEVPESSLPLDVERVA